MRIAHIKTITILIAGAVFTAGLIMGFGGYVFAGDPITGLDITISQNPGGRVSDKIYDSSFSKTKSIGLVRKEVGDVLLRYGVGGAEINKVTEALEGKGVYEAELKRFLLAIGINEKDAQDILLEFDKIGISKDSAQGLDAPTLEFTEGAAPSAVDSSWKSVTGGELRTPDATGAVPSASEGTLKDILPSKRAEPASAAIKLMQDTIGKIQERLKDCDNIKVCDIVEGHAKGRADVTDTTKKAIENRNWEEATRLLREVRSIIVGDIKLLEGVEDKGLIADVLGLERALLNQTDSALKKMSALKPAPATTPQQPSADEARENVKKYRRVLLQQGKVLRDNFRENVRTTIGHVDHGKTGRIALAHGKGLRMINRYRSAIARFDHILGRLESRIEKIENEAQARAKGKLDILTPPPSLILLIEEAKNTQVLNNAKLVELEAKYESLLLGKNSGGVAKEARAIAKELKSEIEKLHGLLDDIRQATGTINTTRSNTF